jgi:hypothetical protein
VGKTCRAIGEATLFNLPQRVSAAISTINGHEVSVLMHNDAVVQGLSEAPFMTDVEHWGVMTIGTGLGNARFTNRAVTSPDQAWPTVAAPLSNIWLFAAPHGDPLRRPAPSRLPPFDIENSAETVAAIGAGTEANVGPDHPWARHKTSCFGRLVAPGRGYDDCLAPSSMPSRLWRRRSRATASATVKRPSMT